MFLRSLKLPFDFKANCFICTKPASIDKLNKKVTLTQRKTVCSVQNKENNTVCVQDKCMTAGNLRNDKWGKE